MSLAILLTVFSLIALWAGVPVNWLSIATVFLCLGVWEMVSTVCSLAFNRNDR